MPTMSEETKAKLQEGRRLAAANRRKAADNNKAKLADKCFGHAQMCATAERASPAVARALLKEAAVLLNAASKALKP